MSDIAKQSRAGRYSWRLWLRPRACDGRGLATERMTAAEQMFFLGAPLAHILDYEKGLRTRRNREPQRTAGRLTRISIRREAALAD